MLVGKIIESIKETEHTKLVLKADGEPPIRALKGEVLRRLGEGAVPVEPPPYEHESNGSVENAVKLFKGVFRVHLLALESKTEACIPILHCLFSPTSAASNGYA